MSIKANPENIILFKVELGEHKGKNYLFKESNKRYQLLRAYVKNRPEAFRNQKYFLISGINLETNKWDYGNYSNAKPFTKHIPLPEVIYDIHNDKVYEYQGQLWVLQ